MRFKNLVITGTGRSGTRYASELFTKCGLPVSHQRVFTTSSALPKWKPNTGDSSAFAAPRVTSLPEDTLVIHQVRNPALVLSSLLKNKHVPGQRGKLKGNNPGVAFYLSHVPGLEELPLKERVCALWVGWNRLVERINHQPNYVFHRVEDYSQTFMERILGFFGLPWNSTCSAAFVHQSKITGGTGQNKPMYFGDIAEEQREALFLMACRYGYEVSK